MATIALKLNRIIFYALVFQLKVNYIWNLWLIISSLDLLNGKKQKINSKLLPKIKESLEELRCTLSPNRELSSLSNYSSKSANAINKISFSNNNLVADKSHIRREKLLFAPTLSIFDEKLSVKETKSNSNNANNLTFKSESHFSWFSLLILLKIWN